MNGHNDTERERRVIATLIWDNQYFDTLTDGLQCECFADELCRNVYAIIRQMHKANLCINDTMTIADKLADVSGGKYTLVDVVQLADYPILTNVQEHIAHLIDTYNRSKVINKLQEAIACAKELTTPIEQTISAVTEQLTRLSDGGRTKVVGIKELREELYNTINANLNENGTKVIRTGFECFDKSGGLHLSDLVIIGAESSQGKTSLATTFAVNASALSDAKVCMFSMEMTPMQMASRMISPIANIPSNKLLFQPLTAEELQSADQAINKAARLDGKMYFDNRSINNIDSILTSIRTMHARYGVEVFIVDYIQIIDLGAKSMNNEQAIADAARRFKNIAKELNVCVILLSQLNRDRGQSGNPEPTSARLRASGQINEAADLTLLVYRPCVYGRQYPQPYDKVSTENTAMLKVDKDRNGGYGGIGSHIVGFNPTTTHFFDLHGKLPIAMNKPSEMPF